MIPTKPKDLIKLITGIIKAFEPTTKEIIETQILDAFTDTWNGYICSINNSKSR